MRSKNSDGLLLVFDKAKIRSSGYNDVINVTDSINYNLTVTTLVWYPSHAFDENLYEHISQELADDAGRESDRS